jgi:outer membrane protein insertion porin family
MLKRISYIALVLCLPTVFSQSTPAQKIPQNVKLAKIEYQGLSLFTPGEINSAAGLKIGQHVTKADLDSAAKRLSYWGCFTIVQFSYRHDGMQMTVSFQLVENKTFAACIFDNFVGFKDQQLLNAIQQELPSFKGKVPFAGTMLEDISQILEKFLNRNGRAGQVSFSPVHQTQYIVFSIKNYSVPIYKITFDGNAEELTPILEQAASKLINSPYSRWQIEAFSKQTLASFMHKYGYWKFSLDGIAAEKMNDGALAKLSFNSGPKYTWAGVLWLGNSVKSNSELDSVLGLKNGDIAARDIIEAGLTNISASYLKNGYIEYRLINPNPIIDDKNSSIKYQVRINEGSQYRMGRFIPMGIPGSSLPFDKLIKQWQIKPGEVFDAIYFDEFKEKCFKPWLGAYASNGKLEIAYGADRAQMTVNVMVRPPITRKF